MRILAIVLICGSMAAGCRKKEKHICRCDDNTSIGEVHQLGDGLSYDERQSACKQFQTIDSAGNVIKTCKIFVPI